MKILYAVKDFAAAKYLQTLITASKEAGHDYKVIADPSGKGKDFLVSAGIELIEDIESSEYDVIISGCSHPSGIEESLCKQAEESGKKIIIFPDTWCKTTERISVVPEIILCIDEINAKININGFSKTEVVGDILTPNLKLEKMNKCIFVALQSEEASKAMVTVLQNFEQLPSYKVFVRSHPKYAGQNWTKEIIKQISEISNFGKEDIPSKVLEENCEITISTFSGSLKVSSFNGKQAVSAISPEAKKGMLNSTGLKYFPLVKYGYATEIVVGKSWGEKDLQGKRYPAKNFDKEKFLKILTSL